MTSYTFEQKLRDSHEASDNPVWGNIYANMFPGLQAIVDMRHDGIHQRQGIDRILIMKNGKKITVDEKIRKQPFDDIALEFTSNDRRQTPGWACNPDIACDYIAYAIDPLGKGWLLPTLQLQIAWDTYGNNWRKGIWPKGPDGRWEEGPGTRNERFTATRGHNGVVLYKTLFCPVPGGVVMTAIGQNLRFKFPPGAFGGNENRVAA
jgi:hypothetical protein